MGAGESNLVDENGEKLSKEQIKEHKKQQKEAKKAEKLAKKEAKKAEKQAKKEQKKDLRKSESTTKVFVGGNNHLKPENSSKTHRVMGHLGLLKRKINDDSTFGAKLHDRSSRFDRDAMSSRISGRNRSTSGSPGQYNPKAVGINSPNYIEEKRKIYGQYHASPGSISIKDSPHYHKTPRQLAVYHTEPLTEAPPSNFKLVSCPNCGRNFNKNNLARHEAHCQKNAQKKTKVFNSKKQRAVTEDEEEAVTWQEKQKKKKMNNAMGIAQDYSTADEPTAVVRYKMCPICKTKQNTGGFELHFEECNQRKMRMEQRKLQRQLGPRQLLRSKKEVLF
ncbi:unnamed protein product [Moneuplotes crassus]|uniref:C2HC/C3H-type domain-containing protein n=1 Tax=Euplotes crassus TaxID=5936 RepID=A0AAD1XIM2_EUPCR|nr:unnamed protein product [Moneuplotes crassus]